VRVPVTGTGLRLQGFNEPSLRPEQHTARSELATRNYHYASDTGKIDFGTIIYQRPPAGLGGGSRGTPLRAQAAARGGSPPGMLCISI
jgi:hypothetical protein